MFDNELKMISYDLNDASVISQLVKRNQIVLNYNIEVVVSTGKKPKNLNKTKWYEKKRRKEKKNIYFVCIDMYVCHVS